MGRTRSGDRQLHKHDVPDFDLGNRLALSIAEAAAAVGLSENTFRTVMPEIERVTVGRRVLIPVRALERWLGDRAQRHTRADDSIVDDLLKDIG